MEKESVKNKLEIKVTKVTQSRLNEVDFDNLPFGSIFTDHMFIAEYADGDWQSAEIKPFGNISMHPASNVFHYGQAIFEGMKAYKQEDGTPVIFRIDEHIERLNKSAERMCIPAVPASLFDDAVKQLVSIDQGWIPTTEGASLYLRPFIIGTEETVGVKPSSSYKFMIIACPVKAFYSKPVDIVTANKYVRAAKGGVGEAKAAGNYAAALLPSKLAYEQGFQQILWMDPVEFKYIQEAGTMNIFVVIGDKVLTPATDGAILKGITRKSLIHLLRERGVEVEERSISIDEIIEAYEKGELKEVFGSGTAAVVSIVASLTHNGSRMELPKLDENSIALSIKKEISDIRLGVKEDKYNWITKLK